MKRSLNRSGAALLCLLAGCAGMAYQPTSTSDVFTTDALPMYMGSPESKLRPLIDRAPFDFNCPPEQMTYKVMGRTNTVGVIGCGKRATYALVSGVGWVMNTASEDFQAAPGTQPAPAAQPAPAPAAQPAPAPAPAPAPQPAPAEAPQPPG